MGWKGKWRSGPCAPGKSPIGHRGTENTEPEKGTDSRGHPFIFGAGLGRPGEKARRSEVSLQSQSTYSEIIPIVPSQVSTN